MDLHKEMLDDSTKNVKDTGVHLKEMLNDVRELVAQLRQGDSEGESRKRQRGRGMIRPPDYTKYRSGEDVSDDEA
eukprot:2480798-Rhodomonas_salina.1